MGGWAGDNGTAQGRTCQEPEVVTAACAVGIRNLPLPIESVKAFEGTAAGYRPDNLVTPAIPLLLV